MPDEHICLQSNRLSRCGKTFMPDCLLVFWIGFLGENCGFWEFQKYQISDFRNFMRFSDTIDDQISDDMLKIG